MTTPDQSPEQDETQTEPQDGLHGLFSTSGELEVIPGGAPEAEPADQSENSEESR